MVERQEVHELGRVLAVERGHLLDDLLGHVLHERRVVPDRVEHGLEAHRLGRSLEVADAGDHAGLALVAEPFQGEGVGRASHEGMRLRVRVLHVVAAGRGDHAALLGRLEGRTPPGPFGALPCERPLVQVVAQRELQARAADACLAGPPAHDELTRVLLGLHLLGEGRLVEDEPQLVDLRELVLELAEREDREVRRDDGKLRAVVDGIPEGVAETLPPRVVEVFHGVSPSGSALRS